MGTRLAVCASILIVCMLLGGCGGGGGDSPGWTDHFEVIGSDKWQVDEQVTTVDGQLRLSSTPGKGAEIQAPGMGALYGTLEFRAQIANWAVDTSIGFESWAGGHRAILVAGGEEGGQPQGYLAVLNPAQVAETYIKIPGWDQFKDQMTDYRIEWHEDSILLYVNDELKITYQPDSINQYAPIPTDALGVRLNASNDHEDIVMIDQLSVNGGYWTWAYADDFSQLQTNVDDGFWTIMKGNSATNCKSWLKLVSKGPGEGAQVQTREAFRYGFLEVKAESSNWNQDTKIGYELWAPGGYYGILITEGKLRVASPACSPPDIPIDGWDTIKGQANVFKIVWLQDSVQVYVNNGVQPAASYQGPCIPDVPLKVRLNASNDIADELRVDYVTVRY
jgi:hypothetical protein